MQSEKAQNTVKVWDVPVRLFHWTLVVGFAMAYLTAENQVKEVHVLIGYGLCLLLIARLLWGFVGSRYARFSSFVFSPAETLNYLRSMKQGRPKHYYGHNPAGALMVFALLGVLATIFASGLSSLAVIDFEGPLLVLVDYVDDETSYLLRDIHEFFPVVALVLIPLHLLGVVGGSLQHKENLVRAMITGRKPAVESASNQEH